MKIHVAQKLQRDRIKGIKISILLKNFGQSLLGIFEPVIFYNILDQRFELVLYYYGIKSFLYAMLYTTGQKLCQRLELKKI